MSHRSSTSLKPDCWKQKMALKYHQSYEVSWGRSPLIMGKDDENTTTDFHQTNKQTVSIIKFTRKSQNPQI